MVHGTVTAYTNKGCRCDKCRAANTEARRAYRRNGRHDVDRDPLAALLAELFPYGLTDDCPAARSRRSVVV